MAVEQFCLKWNNFHTSILTAFESLQVTEDLADVTLTCEGNSVKAHKFILSACSPYFRNVFKNNPCSHPIVILKDVFYDDMIAVLNFMYHGEVLISKSQLQSFLQTAETLQVSGLKSLSDVCQKKKPKRNSTDDEACPKKSKPSTKVPETPANEENFEMLCMDEIKVEVEVEETEPMNDDGSCHDQSGGSLLEAALESKEVPSILERSLTSHSTVKSPTHVFQQSMAEKIKDLYIPRKPPDETEDQSSRENDTADVPPKNDYVPSSELKLPPMQLDVQPHHSSQCGNCPHCGKVYSNQSALKYHVRLVHSDFLNLYCCHLCPLTFDFRDCYKKHMVDVHSIRS